MAGRGRRIQASGSGAARTTAAADAAADVGDDDEISVSAQTQPRFPSYTCHSFTHRLLYVIYINKSYIFALKLP